MSSKIISVFLILCVAQSFGSHFRSQRAIKSLQKRDAVTETDINKIIKEIIPGQCTDQDQAIIKMIVTKAIKDISNVVGPETLAYISKHLDWIIKNIYNEEGRKQIIDTIKKFLEENPKVKGALEKVLEEALESLKKSGLTPECLAALEKLKDKIQLIIIENAIKTFIGS